MGHLKDQEREIEALKSKSGPIPGLTIDGQKVEDIPDDYFEPGAYY